MSRSIFAQLIPQYDESHPLLGKDSQAYPLTEYSLKKSLLDKAGAFEHLTMDDFIQIEARRTKQVIEAAYATNDTDLVMKLMDVLYPLMLEDIESGNSIAIEAYQPLVTQIGFLKRSLGSNSLSRSAQTAESKKSFSANTSNKNESSNAHTPSSSSSSVHSAIIFCWVIVGVCYAIFVLTALFQVFGKVEIPDYMRNLANALFWVGLAMTAVAVILNIVKESKK